MQSSETGAVPSGVGGAEQTLAAPPTGEAGASGAERHGRASSDVAAAGVSALNLARGVLRSRFGLLALTATAVAAGLFVGWDWVVALGAAPLLLSLLPCAAMCALGLCMKRGDGESCSSKTLAQNNANPAIKSDGN